MRLCEHGVEKIPTEAGTQNQETARKTLSRQVSTKISRGAMCSPRRKPEKGDILRSTFNQFILRRARERVTENRDKVPIGPSGEVVPEDRSRKLHGVATCYGNEASSTGGRQEAENDRFATYCS